MGFLADKKILITGLLSNRSIAYGIAQACRREGATLAFTYVNDDLKERVVKLAGEFGSVPVLPCDVASDEQIGVLFDALKGEWGTLDGLLHSIAFAPREALAGAGIGGFSKILRFVEKTAPLRRNVTIDEVGNVAAFLLSDLASAVTGEITYVDCGFSIVAAGMTEE